MTQFFTKRVTIPMSPEMHDELEAVAEIAGRTLTHVTRKMIEAGTKKALAKYNRKPKGKSDE